MSQSEKRKQPNEAQSSKQAPKFSVSADDEREREEIEREPDLHQEQKPLPTQSVMPITPNPKEKAKSSNESHASASPATRKTEKEKMLELGYPAHLIIETPDGKAIFDFGAAEDEALLNGLNIDSDSDSEKH